MRRAFLIFSFLLFAGCHKQAPPFPNLQVSQIKPFVDIQLRRQTLMNLTEKERDIYCRKSKDFKTIKIHIESNVKMTGNPDFATVNVQENFVSGLNKLISLYLRGENELDVIYAKLKSAASVRAYEKVLPYFLPGGAEYNPYNEPIYHQAHILQPLGTILPELERVYGNDDSSVLDIKKWGDRIFKSVTSGRDDPSQTGPDLPAVKAMASAIWGTATKNVGAIEIGYRNYVSALRTIGPGGRDLIWWRKVFIEGKAQSSRAGVSREVRYRDLANSTYGRMVIAAEALVQAGVSNAYDIPEKGRSIHEAVAWLLKNTETEDLHRQYWGDGARTVSWFEIYAARFPQRAKQLEKESFIGDMLEWEPRFFGVMMGGGTTCLFRPIRN